MSKNEKPKMNPRQMVVTNQANNNENNGIYTYTPTSKVKTVQQNKVQQIDTVNKRNKKLHLPVKEKKEKTSLSRNQKAKLK